MKAEKVQMPFGFYECNFSAQWAPTCLGQDGENKNTN